MENKKMRIKPRSVGGSMTELPDRRQRSRWLVPLRCRFQHPGGMGTGRLIDLSLGGAFVETSLELKVGAEISLKILPHQIAVEGIVRHAGRYEHRSSVFRGFGLEFNRVSPNAFFALKKLVDSSQTPAEAKRKLDY